jgi:hypothetical protein
MYAASSSTHGTPAGRLGDYQKSTFVIPTATQMYGGQPVTGGLGLDLSSLKSSPIFWLAAAGAAYYFFFRKR